MTTSATTTALVVTSFCSAALYCVLELGVLLAATCRRCHGLYFCSLLAASCGVALYAVGFLLRDLGLVDGLNGHGRGQAGVALYMVLIAVGWCAMVTGQSLVLYSRLPLLWATPSSPVDATRRTWMLRAVLVAIVLDALVGHGAAIGLLAALTLSATPERWAGPYDVVNIVQAVIFFMQEVVLAGIYIFEAAKMLRRSAEAADAADDDDQGHNNWRRRLQWRLISANVAAVLLSTVALAPVFTAFRAEQAMFRALAYAVKLKLDLVALDDLAELTAAAARDDDAAPGPYRKSGSGSHMQTFYIEDDQETASSRRTTRTAAPVHTKDDVLSYEASVSGGAAEFARPYRATDDAISVVRSTHVSHRRKVSFFDMLDSARGEARQVFGSRESQRSMFW